MSGFAQGPIWPDIAGTPTDPTVAYVTSSRELEIFAEPELAVRVEVTGAACSAVQLQVEVATNAALAWRVVAEKTILGATIGMHQAQLSLPKFCHVRISARRIGGNANTLVTVRAETRQTLGEMGLDGQAIEHVASLACWDDGVVPPAPLALPLVYGLGPAVGGTWIDVGEADTLVVTATILGPTTTVELRLEETLDDGATISVVATGDLAFDGTDGTHRVAWPVIPGGRYRLNARRVGAAATMIAHARAYMLRTSARQEVVLAPGVPPFVIGAIADEVPSAVADGEHVHLITDLERFLRVVSKSYDVLVAADLVATVNPDSSNRDAAAQVVCDETNLAASATFPSVDGVEIGDRPGLAFILSLEDVTSVRFDVSNDRLVWDDATSQIMADGALGRAAAYFTSGAAVTTIFSGTWNCGHQYIRLYVTVPNATNTIYIDLIQRAR